MCVIVAKEAGINMPSEDKLKNCFDHNRDGAGIMLASKGKVFGFKGYMTWESFKAALNKLEKRFGSLRKLPVVMHFRIGTHGENIPENTHPFPLCANYDKMRETHWVSAQGVAHNGIISALSYHPDISAENVSDTMVFVKRVIAPIAKTTVISSRPDILEGLGLMAGSKLAFLDGSGKIVTAGAFVKDEEVLYSNSSYKPYAALPAPATGKTARFDGFRLSVDDMRWFKTSEMEEYGLTPLDGKAIGLLFDYDSDWTWMDLDDNFAIDPSTKIIYEWDDCDGEWVEMVYPGEYIFDKEKEREL